jgi:hypothetical protein
MAYLVELPVAAQDGPVAVVKVEVSEPVDGLVTAARPGQVVARAARSMEDMLAGVRPIAQSFVDSFGEMARAPEEIKVEFGLSLSIDADLIITSTAAEAAFSVSLTWKNPDATS